MEKEMQEILARVDHTLLAADSGLGGDSENL